MSQTFYPAGYVLTGEYEGKNIYKETRDSFMIVSGDNDNKIVTDSIFKTYYQDLKTISRSTVKCYEDISSVHHGPNMSSVAKGAFWFGAAGALVSAAVSQSNTYDIALEFKDGDKFLIRITVGGYYQEFKRIFFDFPTITQSSTPAISSNTEPRLQSAPVSQTAPLLERAHIFLEDRDFAKADEYFEKVLDLEPKNATAYVGKLLVDLKITDQSQLSKLETPTILTENPYFIKAQKYGNKKLVSQLKKHITSIEQRIKKEYESTPQGKYEIATNLFANAVTSDDFMKASTIFEQIPEYMDALAYIKKCHTSSNKAKYQEALDLMNDAKTEAEYEEAANIFKSLHTYKNAEALVEKCFESARAAKKDNTLLLAQKEKEKNNIESYEKAIMLFESVKGWRDADTQIIDCQKRIKEIKAQIESERLENERQEEMARQQAEARSKLIKKTILITTPIVCIFVAFIIIFNTIIVPNVKYNKAITLMNQGELDAAYSIFKDISDYRNSTEKLIDIRLKKLKEVKVGDHIYLGTYEQDNNVSNGKEDIEWMVLDIKDGKALVISKYALDCKQFNSTRESVTWETCTLRQWLNNTFINTAFSAEEKSVIPMVTVPAHNHLTFDTNPGKATQDQIFLLSATEYKKYFDSESRQWEPTAYAIAQGVYFKQDSSGHIEGYCLLRTPGRNQDRVCDVFASGYFSDDDWGGCVDFDNRAVRPAMWIDLTS